MLIKMRNHQIFFWKPIIIARKKDPIVMIEPFALFVWVVTADVSRGTFSCADAINLDL